MWDTCTCVGKSRKSGLKVYLSRMCLVVICTRCTTSHLQYFLFLSSSCLHVCTGDILLWACSYCSMQEGRNAFLLCAAGGHLPVAEYLAPKMKGHLFDGDNVGATALHLAASFGHLSMVEYLVKSCGFDVKAIEKVGLHCLLLFWCILWPLWTQLLLLLHGQLQFWHVYMYQLMWYTTSIYVSPIRFHCVSLTSCAVRHHSTSESSTGRPYRRSSDSAGIWQQCHRTEQCGLTKGSFDFLWSSNVVSWSLYCSLAVSSNCLDLLWGVS